MTKDFIVTLYSQPQTVFTFKEVSLLFPTLSYQAVKNKVHYAVRSGKLKTLRRGVFAKENYCPYELANKLYAPSYVSLETVLQKEGLIFQTYETVFIASYLSRRITIDGHSFFYRKIKEAVLINREGIEDSGTYAIASKERAFLDAVFLYKNYHFDNLKPLNWEAVHRLKTIYESKALDKRVEDYHREFTRSYA